MGHHMNGYNTRILIVFVILNGRSALKRLKMVILDTRIRDLIIFVISNVATMVKYKIFSILLEVLA